MILNELAKYLHNAGLGVYDPKGIKGDIFINTMPASPDNALALFPSASPSPALDDDYKEATIQVMVRDSEGTERPHAGYTRAEGLIQALHGLRDMKITQEPKASYIVLVDAMQSIPVGLGQDANRRYEYSTNFRLIYREEK